MIINVGFFCRGGGKVGKKVVEKSYAFVFVVFIL